MSKKPRNPDLAARRDLRAHMQTGPLDEADQENIDGLPGLLSELVAELGALADEGEQLQAMAKRRGIKIPPDMQRELDELGRAADRLKG